MNVDAEPPSVSDVEFKPTELVSRYRTEPRIITEPSAPSPGDVFIDASAPALIVDRPGPPSEPAEFEPFALPGAAPIEIAAAIGAPDHSAAVALAVTTPHRTPVAQRAAGSALVLPANPLHNLSDESLEGFIDCTIYEESGNVFHPGVDNGGWFNDLGEPGAASALLPPVTVPAMPFTETPSVVVRSIGGTESLAVAPAEHTPWHSEPVDPSSLPPSIVTGALLAPPSPVFAPSASPSWSDPNVEPRVTVRFTGPNPVVASSRGDPNASASPYGDTSGRGFTDPGATGYSDASGRGYSDASGRGFTDPGATGYGDASGRGFTDPGATGYGDALGRGFTDPGATGYSDASGRAFTDAPGSSGYGDAQTGSYDNPVSAPATYGTQWPSSTSYVDQPPTPSGYATDYALSGSVPPPAYPAYNAAPELSGVQRVAAIVGSVVLAIVIVFAIAKNARGPDLATRSAALESALAPTASAPTVPAPPAPAAPAPAATAPAATAPAATAPAATAPAATAPAATAPAANAPAANAPAANAPAAPAATAPAAPPAPAVVTSAAPPAPTAVVDASADSDEAAANPGEPAAPAASTAGSGPCRFTVATIPAGSTVHLDERAMGTSPITLRASCDKHKVDVTRARYQRTSKSVTLTADKPAQLDFVLARPVHTVTVTSQPPGAELAIEGRRAGITPATIQMAGFSSVKMTFTKPGFQPLIKKVYSKLPDDRVTVKLTR